jgi:hypothetical protein
MMQYVYTYINVFSVVAAGVYVGRCETATSGHGEDEQCWDHLQNQTFTSHHFFTGMLGDKFLFLALYCIYMLEAVA